MKFLKICFLMSFVGALQASSENSEIKISKESRPYYFAVSVDQDNFKIKEVTSDSDPKLYKFMQTGSPVFNNVYVVIQKSARKLITDSEAIRAVQSILLAKHKQEAVQSFASLFASMANYREEERMQEYSRDLLASIERDYALLKHENKFKHCLKDINDYGRILALVGMRDEFFKEGAELDPCIACIEHKKKAKPFLDAIKARKQK